jgi:multiple sugar transport system substrate-binding protein
MWNDIHPRNIATIVTLPEAADGQYAEMVARAEDDGTDIFNLDVTWTARFADPPSGRRLIRPINESWLAGKADQSFMEKPLETCRYQGELWALPFNTDAGLLYYRTDLGLRPPFDWAAITTQAKTVLAQRRPGLKAGYTAQLDRYEGLTVNMLEAVWSLGGDLRIDSDGQVTLDRAIWNEAVRLLSPPRGDQPAMVLPDSVNFEESGSRSAFQDGQVMFMRNWPVSYRAMLTGDTPQPDGKPVAFDVAKLPGDSVLGGQNLAISERTERPRAAQALIEFLTGERSQRILFDKGGFAATRDTVYEDETIKQKYPYLDRLHRSLDTARLRPVSPNYVAFSQVLSDRVHDVLLGRQNALPEDLADQLTAALQGR